MEARLVMDFHWEGLELEEESLEKIKENVFNGKINIPQLILKELEKYYNGNTFEVSSASIIHAPSDGGLEYINFDENHLELSDYMSS